MTLEQMSHPKGGAKAQHGFAPVHAAVVHHTMQSMSAIAYQDRRDFQPLAGIYDTPLYYWRDNTGVLFSIDPDGA